MKAVKSLMTIRHGLIAGLSGGLAEIGWVTLYGKATGGNITILARGITSASGVSALFSAYSVVVGITIHMGLACVLGVALAFALRASEAIRGRSTNPFPSMLAALTVVWAVNFLVVLPRVSPEFVQLVPFSVSLTSKLLFGLASAEVFRRQNWAPTAAGEVNHRCHVSQRT